MSQSAQEEIRARLKSNRQALPSDPIGCYFPLLAGMFVCLLMGYVFVVVYMPVLRLLFGELIDKLLIGFHVPLGALLSWLFSGIIICLLLYTWFNLKFRYAWAVFAAVVGIAVLWWMTGLVGQLKGAEPSPIFERMVDVFIRPFLPAGASTADMMGMISPALVIILSLSVLALPAIWYRWSALWSMVVVFWFMLWLTLFFGAGEYQVGIVLLIYSVMVSAIFMFGLRSTSGFLLPIPGREHGSKVLGFLRDWAQGYNFPGYVVVDELYEEDKVEMRVPGNRFRERGFGTGPGFIISDCNYAVAVSSNTKFKGVKGPGVVFTGYADQVMQTVDLRPQLRFFPVEAVTRDGIQIKTAIFTPCKVDSRGKPPKLGEHLPYSTAAGFKAIRAQEMRHEGPSQTPDSKKGYKWEELSRLIATRILQDIISQYDFDELYGPYQPGGDPRRKIIADDLMEQLRDELKAMGIELVGGGISDLQPADPEVYVKRAQNWKEEWESKIALQKSESQAEWLKMVERARMEAQADLILTMGRRLESSMTRTELRPHAALTQFVKLLDELMKRHPSLEGVVPEKTVETLMELRSVIE